MFKQNERMRRWVDAGVNEGKVLDRLKQILEDRSLRDETELHTYTHTPTCKSCKNSFISQHCSPLKIQRGFRQKRVSSDCQ